MSQPEKFLWKTLHRDGTLTRLSPLSGTISPWENWKNLSEQGHPKVEMSEQELQDRIGLIKLPFKRSLSGPEKIIGWGAFSVAIRLSDEEHVAVLKPVSDSKQMYSDIYPGNPSGVHIARHLEEFIPKSHLVYTEGPGGHPSLTKVSKEVAGSTLSEYPLWNILSNRELTESFSHFLSAVLRCYYDTGTLADVSGHVSPKTVQRITREFWPFFSKNVVVEEGSSKVFFVDTSAYPENQKLTGIQKAKRSLITLANLASYHASDLLLKFTLLAHNIRGKLVKEGIPQSEPEDVEFKKGFADIVSKLNDSGFKYRIVGSTALAATLKKFGVDIPVCAKRFNKTIRDVDVIVMEPEEATIELQNYFNSRTSLNHGYPEVSLSPIVDPENTINRTDLCFNSRDTDGNYCKQFKNHKFHFQPNDLKPYEVELFGTKFVTFPPQAQAGLYLIRGGSVKFKDVEKLALFVKSTGCKVPSHFRDFAELIRTKYPREWFTFEMKELINFWTGGLGTVAKKELKKILAKLHIPTKTPKD